jgi:hypothetical protein
MSWQPLLEGVWKDRALESVQAVVDDLASLGCGPAGEPSLAGGTAGLALVHGYLEQARRGQGHAPTAVRYLRQAIAAVADQPALPTLYSGLAGVGWALAHLQGRVPEVDGEEDLLEIDGVLLSHLESSPWSADYDLVGGLVGFGVYALERLKPGADATRLAAGTCLERVLDQLAATAERRPEGVTWWTDPAWLIPETREKFPRGYYNLGLAHGVPGVIALLGYAIAARGTADKARLLLNGAVCWLLAQQLPEGPAAFSTFVVPGFPPAPARLAWCYGDLGLAVALLWAARCVGEAQWERAALAIARRAAARPPEHSGVVDAGLCHGAAGVGHLFNRLFQATGEACFADAARFWLQRTLALRQPDRGIAGYLAWSPGADGALTWVAEPGLLTGAAGVALALLAAATPVEPAWDRMLLAAVPPR